MELQMEKISVTYPGVRALNNASLTIKSGSAHALIGANGAGKSTLMNVLSGSAPHYTGTITLNGDSISIRSVKEAQDQGIQIVQQEVDKALVPYATIGETMQMRAYGNKSSNMFIRWKTLHEKASAALHSLGINISSKKLVSELSLAEKQMVLIAAAVMSECQLLILDEPTAPLSISETKRLFKMVRELLAKQVAVVFISHRLPELFEICDVITVMKNGCHVSTKQTSDTSINQVVEEMLGEPFTQQYPDRSSSIGEPLLIANSLSDGFKVQQASLHVRSGEIIGLAGLVGAGKTELCKLLFGASQTKSGSLTFKGRTVTFQSPYQAVESGLALIPEERRKEGVMVQESIQTNVTAATLTKHSRPLGWLNQSAQKKSASKIISDLSIKTPHADVLVQHLSGGNQQKVAIGKWLATDADVYIFDEPTKGVDVGARKDIFTIIHELAARGKGIIYASCELADVIGMTDRTYVLYDGQIVKELRTAETSEEELLYLSTGGNQDV
ncbi:sugar ABC transporter ATP-binding protein [Alkalihalobacillus sp. FSL R5-0424]